MAGAYENPMVPASPPNPGGGGLPGQPRNPAAGGYPSREPYRMDSPMQPGQVPSARPDPAMMLAGQTKWRDMMLRRKFPGRGMNPGWGGGWFGGGQVDPGFNIGGGVPYEAPTFESPNAPGNPDQKAADLARYKANVRGSAGQTASAMNGMGMTNAYFDTSAPDWMDPARAAEMKQRISGRVIDDAMPDMGGGVRPQPYPAPLPPWFAGPGGPMWGSPFIPPRGRPVYGGGAEGPMPPPQGPGGNAKPGGPPGGGPDPAQMQRLRDLRSQMGPGEMPAGAVPA